MINTIVKGIAVALKSAFSYTVHTEKLIQGAETPCFLIERVSMDEKKRIDNQYIRTHILKIKYFSKSKTMEDNHDVAEKLYSILEYITLPDGALIRSDKAHHDMVENVLHFYVTYTFQVTRAKVPTTKMSGVSIHAKG